MDHGREIDAGCDDASREEVSRVLDSRTDGVADGDWQLFIETKPGEFEPKEVEVLRRSAGLAEIEGLEPGTRVVTQGAFFLQSELAKAGFDVLNH